MTTVPTLETLPQRIARMDADRLRSYRENLEFYRGHQWEGRARGRERRLTFNYCRAFLEKVTSYLMSGMNTVVHPLGSGEEAVQRALRAEEALRRVYEEEHLEALDFETELDAAILGDGAYKVTWDPREERVRVSAPDVQGLYAWWTGDDVSRVWRVASRYRLSAEEAEALYGVRPSLGNGRSKDVTITEVWTPDAFELWVDNARHLWGPNPYTVIPFVLFPNLREPKQFWGVSDIPPLMEPARELNRAVSQLSMILELSGNPIAVQPGAVWELPERARAYLLDLLQGGGIKLHVDFIDLVYRALHDLSEAPRTTFGDNPRNLSGVALEMELHPLLQKVRRKRLIRTAAYKRRNELILRILEQRTGDRYLPVRQEILWGPLLPQDRMRLAQEERTLVEAGIHSRRRAMESFGVEDPEAEWARWLEERGK